MSNEELNLEQEIPEEQTAPEAEAAEETADAGDVITAELAASREKYMRLAAEYDNFRKRSARERDALFTDVRADTVKKFLPVYDNLLRAVAMTPEGDPGRKGIEMTLTQFETVLTSLGVTAIEALGKEFNPELHNAVMHVEDDEVGENIIVEEFEKGFKLGEKVIRFSIVKVAN
ncbi:MAG: nucleotide exchange factor GrpE [Oscillospiraceae bacterium]|nr:nucleotide exchange factor GrpE [Oscillospiraceae bacterium]